MTHRVQINILKIFVQIFFALVVFSALASVTSAKTSVSWEETKLSQPHLLFTPISHAIYNENKATAQGENSIDQALFENTFGISAIDSSAHTRISYADRLLSITAQHNASFMVHRRGQHDYSSKRDVAVRDEGIAWPFLSVALHAGDLDIKLGSKYNQ